MLHAKLRLIIDEVTFNVSARETAPIESNLFRDKVILVREELTFKASAIEIAPVDSIMFVM